MSIWFIPFIFVLATCYLYLLSLAAPNLSSESSLKFPVNLNELTSLAALLKLYCQTHHLYVLLLFCSGYIYKQTFAIPGSVFLNLLAGALFGIPIGFFLVCSLTTIGATCCYLLSRYFGKDYIVHLFPGKLKTFQIQIQENLHHLFYFLLFIRIMPFSPNWAINILSPILDVPILHFSFSVFFGLMPYNFITVQAGAMLSELTSLDQLLTAGTVWKLLLLAMVAGLPGILKSYYNKRIAKQQNTHNS